MHQITTQPFFCKYYRIIKATVAPSPAADAACLVDPARTSPAVNRPGMEVIKVLSVTPYIPLALLSLGFFIYGRYFSTQPASGMMSSAFDDLYFNNPFWIASHSFLHSPTALIIYAILLWRFVDKAGTRGHWRLSFVFGCMVHSVIDILTHYNDGPVLPFRLAHAFSQPDQLLG